MTAEQLYPNLAPRSPGKKKAKKPSRASRVLLIISIVCGLIAAVEDATIANIPGFGYVTAVAAVLSEILATLALVIRKW